jgi:hypothetical protein
MKPPLSALWLDLGSGSAAVTGSAYCHACGNYAPVENAVCGNCITKWYQEREKWDDPTSDSPEPDMKFT